MTSDSALSPVTDDTFEELVTGSGVPVVVDVYTPWCGPCKMLAPVLEELASEYGDKVRFVKLDADENPEVKERFDVDGYPTVLLFDGGSEVSRFAGSQTRRVVRQHVDALLLGRAREARDQVEEYEPCREVLRLIEVLQTWDASTFESLTALATEVLASPDYGDRGEEADAALARFMQDVDEVVAQHIQDQRVLGAVRQAAAILLSQPFNPPREGRCFEDDWAEVLLAPLRAALGPLVLPSRPQDAADVLLAAMEKLPEASWDLLVTQYRSCHMARPALGFQDFPGAGVGLLLLIHLSHLLAVRDLVDVEVQDRIWAPLEGYVDRENIEVSAQIS